MAITQIQGETWKQDGVQISGIAIVNLQERESEMVKTKKAFDGSKLPVFKFHGDFGKVTNEYDNMVVSQKPVNRIVNGKRVPVVQVTNYRTKTLADLQAIFSDEYINLLFWTAYNPRLNNPERVAEGKSDEERFADDIGVLSKALKKAVKAGNKPEEIKIREKLIALL